MYKIKWRNNKIDVPNLETAYEIWNIIVLYFLTYYSDKNLCLHITVHKEGTGIDFNKGSQGEEGNPNTFIYWDGDLNNFVKSY